MTSDHVPLSVELKRTKSFSVEKTYERNTTKRNTTKAYNYNKANWDKFKSNLPKSVPIVIVDVEKLNKFITMSLINAADSSIPLRIINHKF